MNLYVTDNGDIELDRTTNNLRICKDQEEIRQIIIRNLETLQGEWFLDTSIGVPWFSSIFEKNVSLNKVDSVIIEEITRSAGVISLLTYSSALDKASRTFTVQFSAETEAGILNFDQTIAI